MAFAQAKMVERDTGVVVLDLIYWISYLKSNSYRFYKFI